MFVNTNMYYLFIILSTENRRLISNKGTYV